ncbi:MAG: VCBS repeat-containing protein [Candidatus Promineofilum sp.]|nr:VCBS repeat-containing protein [Promineifilum sp.]
MKSTPLRWYGLFGLLALFISLVWFTYSLSVGAAGAQAAGGPQIQSPTWLHLSTANGDLPVPSSNSQQVLTLVADLNNDGTNDFVIGSRRGSGASLVWYRRDAAGWTNHLIESESLQLEAGGAVYDIDSDGDLDVVAGSNSQTNKIWWWENPYPALSPTGEWTRRTIKDDGSSKHHDMMFGNFDDDAAVEFVYWNQNAEQLLIVDIPSNPLTSSVWPDTAIVFDAPDNKREGLTEADVDGDGKSDIIGGGYWFKHTGGTNFTSNLIENNTFIRVAAGQLIPGDRPEIVQVPGDASGVGRWFEWNGGSWVGHDLPLGQIEDGHSLDIADVDGDGHLDIFVGEMRYADSRNPDARTLLLLGDGQGNFTVETVATGFGHHESRLADLDGDGDFDILGKPFTWDTPRIDIWLNGAEQPTCDTPLNEWETHLIDNTRPNIAVFVRSADLNGDGLADIISGAWWYRNPGSPGGAWQRNTIGAGLDQAAVAVDFDDDGDTDILGTTWNGANPNQKHKGNTFVWARNDGSGQFTIMNNIQSGTGDFLQGAVYGTFTTGSSQVLLSWHNIDNRIEGLTVPANPSTQQWPQQSETSLSQSEDLSRGDIDRDGDQDLLLGTIWLENNGGGWIDHTLYNTSQKPDRNRLADINDDGRLDAVVGYEAISVPGKLAWYEAPSNPTQPWTEHVIDTIIGPMSLDVGDMDGDGDIDLVAGEHNQSKPNQARIFAYEQTQAGFQRYLIDTGDEHHDGAQLVDVDNDGDLDVVSIGWTHNRVIVYEQIGCQTGPQPTGTPMATATAQYTPTPTATNQVTPTATPTATATTPPGGSSHFYYLSSTTGGNVGGVTFADEDILRFDSGSGQWSLYFDGSDVGLDSNDVDGFYLRDDAILLSLGKPQNLAGLGLVDDSDVLLFIPTSIGANTAGQFSLYFDGSNVGLTTNGEDINALTETDDGRLIMSTVGKVTVPGLTASKWDLLLFDPDANGYGTDTAGVWSFYVKGSSIGLSAKTEAITGASWSAGNRLYLSTQGAFSIGGISGGSADVFVCDLTGTGVSAACSPAPALRWRGGDHGYGSEMIDSLTVREGGG